MDMFNEANGVDQPDTVNEKLNEDITADEVQWIGIRIGKDCPPCCCLKSRPMFDRV
jgi:hypothetical protein